MPKNINNKISDYNCANTETGDNNEERKDTKSKEYYLMTEPINRYHTYNQEDNNSIDQLYKYTIQTKGKIINKSDVLDEKIVCRQELIKDATIRPQPQLITLSCYKDDKESAEKSEKKNSSFNSLSNNDLSFKQTTENAPEKLLRNNLEPEKLVKHTVTTSLDLKKRIFKNFFESSMKSKLSEHYEKYVRKSHRYRNNSTNQSYDSNNESNTKSSSITVAKKENPVSKNIHTSKPQHSFSISKNIDYSKEQNPIRKKKFLNTSTVSVNIEKSDYDTHSFSFRENSAQPREKTVSNSVTNKAVSQSPSNHKKILKKDQFSSNKKYTS